MKKGISSLLNVSYVLLICITLFLLKFDYSYFMISCIVLLILYFTRKNYSISVLRDKLDLLEPIIHNEKNTENGFKNKVVNIKENMDINKTNIKFPSNLGSENDNIIFQEGDFYERRNKILKRLFFKTNDRYSFEKELRLRKEQQLKYSRQARKANIEAEKLIQNIYKIEIERNSMLVEAMFKAGKACKYNFISIYRKLFLITKKLMNKIDN